MAMVSVKHWRTGALMTAVLLSGCAGLGTVGGQGSTPEAPAKKVVESKPSAPNDGEASQRYLPQQAYDKQGNKIAYEPSPNPYTGTSEPVPPEAVTRFRKADSLMADEQYREARKAFEAITRDYPDLSGPWVKLGELAEIGERMERAEKSYKKALEVNPENVNAYLALALFQRRSGDFEAARDTYIAALALWKDFPEAHLNLAILFDLYMNQPALAQPHFEAYDFLTSGDNPRVADWLIEIRRRTGIETSFIDNPPPAPKATEEAAAAEPMSAEKGPETTANEEKG
ncbi:tetratricopeptide repeat protein [Marinobacter arenosus]|uniref:tetratricopeptide repeat protein n=1 Tax=Marinobacter arenosus TaxID=2856822 RepID=UPI001C4A8D3B|nr:tetratricopeptide repeat protein [Marinobacter arenosus]MBW0147523.1 tetratricopeptide repeat protein [Marinobacter arenosus]